MMDFKHVNIDYENCTEEELLEEIHRLEFLSLDYDNMQKGLKIFINSIYGAVGNEFFKCYNINVAEAITQQGKDLILYAVRCLNKYFKEHWHKDKDLHKKMNITVTRKVLNDVCIYGDTDSTFMKFEEIIETVDKWDGTFVEFILSIYKNRLKEYLDNVHVMYSKRWNTENVQEFELETISHSGIWLGKKKYILDMAWKDVGVNGIFYDRLKKLYPKGIELVQRTYPQYTRNILKELITKLLIDGKTLDYTAFMKLVKKYKDEFKIQNIDNISMTRGISDYNKYVLNDKNSIVLAPKCPIHTRAAAIYNYNLNKSKYKTKYRNIKSGEAVKYYYIKTDDKTYDVFAYQHNSFPVEFAPEIDYDTMFMKTVLDPINRFMEVLEFDLIPINLVTVNSLF